MSRDEPTAGNAIAYYSTEIASEKFDFFDFIGRPLKGVGGESATEKIDGTDFRVIHLSVLTDHPIAVVNGLKLVFILDSNE